MDYTSTQYFVKNILNKVIFPKYKKTLKEHNKTFYGWFGIRRKNKNGIQTIQESLFTVWGQRV